MQVQDASGNCIIEIAHFVKYSPLDTIGEYESTICKYSCPAVYLNHLFDVSSHYNCIVNLRIYYAIVTSIY